MQGRNVVGIQPCRVRSGARRYEMVKFHHSAKFLVQRSVVDLRSGRFSIRDLRVFQDPGECAKHVLTEVGRLDMGEYPRGRPPPGPPYIISDFEILPYKNFVPRSRRNG